MSSNPKAKNHLKKKHCHLLQVNDLRFWGQYIFKTTIFPSSLPLRCPQCMVSNFVMINWMENDEMKTMIWNNYGREQDPKAIAI